MNLSIRKLCFVAVLALIFLPAASALQLNSSQALQYSSGSDVDFEVLSDGTVNVKGNVDLGSNDLVDGGTTIWDTSNSYVPTSVLQSDSVTVAGNSVSLGGSTGVAHADLSSIGVDDHHPQILSQDSGTNVIDGPTVMDFRNALSVTNPTGNEIDVAVSESDISHDNIGGVSSGDHHTRPSAGTLLSESSNQFNVQEGSIDHGSISGLTDDDHSQYLERDGTDSMSGALDMSGNGIGSSDYVDFQNHEHGDFDTGGRLYWDASAGLYVKAQNAGGAQTGGGLLWSSENAVGGNAISLSYDSEDEPTIAVNEGGISHDNIAGVSYNDHHGLGDDLSWDGSNNPRLANTVDVSQIESAGNSVELRFDSSNSYIEVEDTGSTTREDIVVGRIYLDDNVGWFDGSGDDLQNNTVDSSEIQNGANFNFNSDVDLSGAGTGEGLILNTGDIY